MMKQKIEAVLSDFSNILPEDLQHFKQELESNLRATLNTAFAKMELVTREEFDIQTNLLQRTRAQLDGLHKKTLALEQQLKK